MNNNEWCTLLNVRGLLLTMRTDHTVMTLITKMKVQDQIVLWSLYFLTFQF